MNNGPPPKFYGTRDTLCPTVDEDISTPAPDE